MRKSSARGREGGDSLPRSFLRPWTAPAAAGAGRLPGQEGCQAASPPPPPVLGHCRRRPLRRAHPGGGAAAAEAERYGTGAAPPPPCGDAGPGGGRLPARPPGAPVSRAPPPGGGPSPSATASGGGGAGLVLPVEAGRLLRPIGPPSVRFPPSPAGSQWEGGRSPLPAHTWGGGGAPGGRAAAAIVSLRGREGRGPRRRRAGLGRSGVCWQRGAREQRPAGGAPSTRGGRAGGVGPAYSYVLLSLPQ